MVWSVLCHLFSCLVDLFTLRPLTDAQKDIQILLLRQQLHVLQRKARQPKRFLGSKRHCWPFWLRS
jgi:hypothetical protein